MLPRADQIPEMKKFEAGLAAYGEPERIRILKRKYAHFRGQQYDHLKVDWFGRNADTSETISPKILVPSGFESPLSNEPVHKKRPVAPVGLCGTIVNRFTNLLFGEKRIPRIGVVGDPDTEAFILAAIKQSRFWVKMNEARMQGGACGAVAISVHLRNGKFCVDVHPSWKVDPEWENQDDLKLSRLVIQYTYYEEELQAADPVGGNNGNPTKSAMKLVNEEYLYRRVIDANQDVIYKPWRVKDGPPRWDASQIDSDRAVVHGLGFAPVVWVQNLPTSDHFDGDADCEGAWGTFDSYDRLQSQAYRALLVNLDPTVILTADEQWIQRQGGNIKKGSDNSIALPSGGNASYLEISGAGIQAAFAQLERLKRQAQDITEAVLIDPEKISGAAQSAKAIEYIFAPMLSKAGKLRGQYGDGAIIPLLEMMVAMARKIGLQGITLPDRIEDDKPVKQKLGAGGELSLEWGPWFDATTLDVQTTVVSTAAAKGAGLIDAEAGIRKVAPYFGIKDIEATMDKIAEEQAMGFGEDTLPPIPEIPEVEAVEKEK